MGGVARQSRFSLFDLLVNRNPGFVYATLGEIQAGVSSAQCGALNVLWVDSQEGGLFDNPGKGADKSLHPQDWNLFHMNIRRNIGERAAAYLSASARESQAADAN